MLQEKKLRVQEEQSLTSALIAEGRGLLDAAAAPANALGEALVVSPNSAQPGVSGEASQAPDMLLNRRTCGHSVNLCVATRATPGRAATVDRPNQTPRG